MHVIRTTVWYLSFLFIVAVGLVLSLDTWLRDFHIHRSDAQLSVFSSVFSQSTVDALDRDVKFHDALLSLTEITTRTLSDAGAHFNLEQLRTWSTDVSERVAQVRVKTMKSHSKRRSLDNLAQNFTSLFGSMIGENSTNGLSGIFDGVASAAIGTLTTPALFLGIGLGLGAVTGLNITNLETARVQASKVAISYNASVTGTNLIAQNIGSGLAGQVVPIFKNVNTSLAIGTAAYALATGIGNATAMGFNLTTVKFKPSNDSSIEGIAGNFGLGLAAPVLSNIDIQSLMSSATTGLNSSLMQQLPQIASAAGQGLGEGIKNGLGLAVITPSRTKKRSVADNSTSDIDVPDSVRLFTRGLSQSFIQGSDLSKLNVTGQMGFTSTLDLQSMLRPLVAGAGAGVGLGFAIGLNFKSADSTPTYGSKPSGDDARIATIAEGFAQNLISNFLLNSTALKAASDALTSNPSSILPKINAAKAIEGFARGAIDGIASATMTVGGVKNLISGNYSSSAMDEVPVLSPSTFNDSINGSAIGFARGLMGGGTILIADIIRNLTGSSSSQSLTASQLLSRSRIEIDMERSVAIRQSPSNTSDSSFFLIDANTLEAGAQKSVDFLTCQGVGGLASIGLSILSNMKTVMKNGSQALSDPNLLSKLPDGPITITSDGNNFQIAIKEAKISINGLSIIPFAVFTALHVFFCILSFLIFLPLYVILGIVWRFSVLAGYPINEAKNRKWRLGFLSAFAVLGLTGIILGIVGIGDARHFRDGHSFIGLITLILIIPTVVFTFARLRTTLPHPSSAAFAGIKGMKAIARGKQCIYLISGVFIQLVLSLGQLAIIQGFSTLRSISLCIIDAVLTSVAVAGLLSFILMLQIGAGTLLGIRMWLERHIAKQSLSDPEKPTLPNITLPPTTKPILKSNLKVKTKPKVKDKGRKSSIRTFGFDTDPVTTLSLPKVLPQGRFHDRSGSDLRGNEDAGISYPFNVRKEGSISSPIMSPGNPFLSDAEQQPTTPKKNDPHGSSRYYNPKTAGYYEYEYDDQAPLNLGQSIPPATTSDSDFLNITLRTHGPGTWTSDRRPSSDLFDPLKSPQPNIVALGEGGKAGPKVREVTEADLWPPPRRDSRDRVSNFARPFGREGSR